MTHERLTRTASGLRPLAGRLAAALIGAARAGAPGSSQRGDQVSLSPRERKLVQRRILPQHEVAGGGGPLHRDTIARRPHRTALYRLTGRYFAEEQAERIFDELLRLPSTEVIPVLRNIRAGNDLGPATPRPAGHPYDA